MIKKKITRTAFLLLAAVAVFALSFIGARVGLTSSGAATENDDLSPATPSIALPGYDEICLPLEKSPADGGAKALTARDGEGASIAF